ncbi:hypothetical protein CTAYLR_008755 [Chrysophaeum taylorii]|uniref:EF-hand domain-containing protein n=1 Tax=Chrysophaeum taylorii TaxID=2483200 RepID=A0AAD7UEV5_9STRA|nr:hypothetical protein CTAYLR_008755 [Chrysophaeum taylorii]
MSRSRATERAKADPGGVFKFRDEHRMRYLARRLKNESLAEAQRWPPETILRMLKKKLDESFQDTRRAFRAIDKNNSGTLCRGELRQVLQEFNVSPTDEDFERMWGSLDADKNGNVSMREFKLKIGELRGDWGPAFEGAVKTSTSLHMPDNLLLLKRDHIKPPGLGRVTSEQVRATLRHRLATTTTKAMDVFRPFDADNDGSLTFEELRRCLAAKLGIELDDADFDAFAAREACGAKVVDYAALVRGLGSSIGSLDYTRSADKYRERMEALVVEHHGDAAKKHLAGFWPQMQHCGHMGAFIGSSLSNACEKLQRAKEVPATHHVNAREAAAMLRAKLAATPSLLAKWFRRTDEGENAITLDTFVAMLRSLMIHLAPGELPKLLTASGLEAPVALDKFVVAFGTDVANRFSCPGIDWGVATVSNKAALDLGYTDVEDKLLPRDARLTTTAAPTTPRSLKVVVDAACDAALVTPTVAQEEEVAPPEPTTPEAVPAPETDEVPERIEEEVLSPIVAFKPSQRPQSSGGPRARKIHKQQQQKCVTTPKAAPRPKSAVVRRSTNHKMSDALGRSPAFAAATTRNSHMLKLKIQQKLKPKERVLLHNGLPPTAIPPPKHDDNPASCQAVWWGIIGRELWQPGWRN